MVAQFFGKPFFVTLGIQLLLFLIGILSFHTSFAGIVLVALGLCVFALTLFRLEWGIAAVLIELIGSSHGHLIDGELFGMPLFPRLVVFVAVMAAWSIGMLFKRFSFSLKDPRLFPWLPLFVAVGIGVLQGLLGMQPLASVVSDGNAYLYLLLLFPFLSVSWDGPKRRMLLQVFCGSAAWVALLSLATLFVFSHAPESVLRASYRFLRDTRMGEITRMQGNFYRIFFPAQMFVLAAGWFLATCLWSLQKKTTQQTRLIWLSLIPVSAVFFLSLSRSLWVGLVVALCLFLFFALRERGLRASASFLLKCCGTDLGGIVLLLVLVLIPVWNAAASSRDVLSIFAERSSQIDDAALVSRWNLLPPLIAEIQSAPLWGKGFGAEVTYRSEDPYVLSRFPDGILRTFSLEWGFLELWLKMGLLGPLAFLFLGYALWMQMKPLLATPQRWIAMAFACTWIMLYASHFFSPYLNHPIGIGLLLFGIPFLPPVLKKESGGSPVAVTDQVPRRAVPLKPVPAQRVGE